MTERFLCRRTAARQSLHRVVVLASSVEEQTTRHAASLYLRQYTVIEEAFTSAGSF